MSAKFNHLQVHTEFSLLDGAIRVPQLVQHCADNNIPAVGLTDNGVLFGAIEFYLRCQDAGVKPIIGCELFLCDDISVKERTFTRLILICTSFKGYQNLSEIVTIANLDGFYYKPRIDLEHLKKYSEDLIAISPGLNGVVAEELSRNRETVAHQWTQDLKALYGDNFYLGLQPEGDELNSKLVDDIVATSKQFEVPLVALNDVYYLTPEASVLREILRCIQTGRELDEETHQYERHDRDFKSEEQMLDIFKDYPEAIANTVAIADKCDVTFVTDQVLLPHFECPNQKTPEEYLEELVWQGIEQKYDEVTDEIRDRIRFELDIINQMQYPIYFLIIYDFLKFCTDEGIPVGPGRGSAAGSIVSYALNITKIDPIRYKLLFERFLNPDRVSMPDVDLDFCIKRRTEVIDYIVQRYGEEHVSMIITFGTMQSRAVVRDVGRALGTPLSDVDYLAKLIPAAPGKVTTIPEALEMVPEFKKSYETNDEHKRLIDYAMKLEGFTRHSSTHAAGVLISRDPLSSIVPLVRNDGQTSSQYAMGHLEKLGLLKMDILGLRNLTVIEHALELIKTYRNEQLDLDALEFTDEDTYALLCSGKTSGIFQLESSGMKELIKDLKPSNFEDVIALLALYRPGPLGSGMVQDFISNKSGETEVKYDLDALEPILKDTYGMILYQEQVMQIASTIGGFTLAQADMLRRAMGKKKKSEMDRLKDEFLKGAEEKQFPVETANKVFELCYKFAEYGFNKSHSAAYAQISYHTAYLKANYTLEYMTALLSSVMGSADRMMMYIADCRDMGIECRQPDINKSIELFSIEEKAIRFGLGAIKNVGDGAIESIIQTRKSGPYESMMDMLLRVDLKQVNKRVVECLIKSGAFDSLEPNRGLLLETYERSLEHAQRIVKERETGQTGLFASINDGSAFSMEEDLSARPLTEGEKLRYEKELMGVYVTGHPLDLVTDFLSGMSHHSGSIGEDEDQTWVTVGGILSDCRKVITKNKSEMMIATMEDLHGEISVLLFQSDNFEEHSKIFVDDNIVKVQGRVRYHQEKASVNCQEIDLISDQQRIKDIHLDVNISNDMVYLDEIRQVCQNNRGGRRLVIHVLDQAVLVHKKYWVSDESIDKFGELLGVGRIWEA